METRIRAARVLIVVVLTMGLAWVVGLGITAAVMFPTARELTPTVPGLESAPSEGWQIIAGTVMQKLFGSLQNFGILCLLVIILLGLAVKRIAPSRASMAMLIALVLGLCAATGCSLYLRQSLLPRMQGNFATELKAARSGDASAAAAAKAAFDADHPISSRTIGAMAISLAISLVGAIGLASQKLEAPRP